MPNLLKGLFSLMPDWRRSFDEIGAVAMRWRVLVILLGSLLPQASVAVSPSMVSFGSTATYPPYNYLESGYPKGMVVDIVRAVEKRTGKPMDVRLISSWTDVQQHVQEGQLDVLGPMAMTEERKRLYDFSYPIIDLSVHFFIRRGRLGIRTVQDVQGMRVGVAAGGLAHHFANSLIGIHVVPLGDDQIQNFKKLANDELDAIIADSWNGGYLLAEHRISEVQMIGDALLSIPAHLAVKKGNNALLAEINDALRLIEMQGEMDKIKEKWRPLEVVVTTREAELQRKNFAMVIIILLGLIALVAGGIWLYLLRREVRRRAAAEVLASHNERRFRAFFDNAMVGMAITLPDKGWGMVNPALCQLLGLSADALMATSWEQLTHTDDLADDVVQFERVLSGEIEGYSMEKRFIRPDGQMVPSIIAVRAVRNPDRGVAFFSAIVMDNSLRKQLENGLHEELAKSRELNRKLEQANNQLLQSEKMAAIGQLAAGVAHELNNPIGFVQSNLKTLEGYVNDLLKITEQAEQCAVDMQGGAADEFRRLCKEIDLAYVKDDIRQLVMESKDGTDRVRRIVQNLKEFSHVHENEWQWADLHRGVESTLTVVWNELKYKAVVQKEFGELPEVYCLASQINQVIMNLLVNAAQAIETQGIIIIRTGVEDIEGVSGKNVWVEVADTGKGIAPENLKRVFEPFFTTKPVGKGTGLGLSLSWGIVERHHGKLEVKSEVGAGTTFRMTLPVKFEE